MTHSQREQLARAGVLNLGQRSKKARNWTPYAARLTRTAPTIAVIGIITAATSRPTTTR